MKKLFYVKKTFAFLFFFVLLLVPFFVSAQGLVPCGGEDRPECHLCHLFEMIGSILDLLLNMIVPLVATLMIMISGIIFFTASGDPGKIEKSKSIIKSVIIGLIISILAWSAVVALYALIGAENPVKWDEICKYYKLDIYISDDDNGYIYTRPGYDIPDKKLFFENRIVEIFAYPRENYKFTGWSNDCDGTESCSIIMDENKTVTANFDPIATEDSSSDNNHGGHGSGGCVGCKIAPYTEAP
jgi:uncharacterized repeat protein (TIGR02543 family)